eukprot:4473406-Pyramimonas_sp.AAC.1
MLARHVALRAHATHAHTIILLGTATCELTSSAGRSAKLTHEGCARDCQALALRIEAWSLDRACRQFLAEMIVNGGASRLAPLTLSRGTSIQTARSKAWYWPDATRAGWGFIECLRMLVHGLVEGLGHGP